VTTFVSDVPSLCRLPAVGFDEPGRYAARLLIDAVHNSSYSAPAGFLGCLEGGAVVQVALEMSGNIGINRLQGVVNATTVRLVQSADRLPVARSRAP
jgi:hypothetical protein